MKVPVVMTTTAQATVFTGAEVRRAIVGNCAQVIGAGILAPLPDIARHVVEAELVRSFGGDVMRPRRRPAKARKAADDMPAASRSQ